MDRFMTRRAQSDQVPFRVAPELAAERLTLL
jgi:hypothetical protein